MADIVFCQAQKSVERRSIEIQASQRAGGAGEAVRQARQDADGDAEGAHRAGEVQERDCRPRG